VLRRVGGYNLDIFHPQSERPYTRDGSVNLAHLLIGSEGTLACTRSLELQLAPLPRPRYWESLISRPSTLQWSRSAHCAATAHSGGVGGPDHDRAGAGQSRISALIRER